MTYSRPEDHQLRLQSARAVAQWELGDPSWANTIVAAYENPQDDWVQEIIRKLRGDKEEAIA